MDWEKGKKGKKETDTYHGTNAVGGCWSKCVVVGVCSIKSSVTKKEAELRINNEGKKEEGKSGEALQNECNQTFHSIQLHWKWTDSALQGKHILWENVLSLQTENEEGNTIV